MMAIIGGITDKNPYSMKDDLFCIKVIIYIYDIL